MQPERDTSGTPQSAPQPSAPSAQPPNQPVTTPSNPVVTLTPDQPGDVSVHSMTMSTGADEPQEMPVQSAPSDEPLRWQATEYIHHEKDVLWFVVFAAIVIALMAVSILVIQSLSFSILIPVMAAALIVYTRRPPRLIDYTLSGQGLFVNDQLYSFVDFKGFGVIRDGREFSIILIPTKRFKLGVSIYFPEEAGEAIVDMLGARLPMQEMHLDLFDRIIHKLRI